MATLNTNQRGAVGEAFTISFQTLFSLYVVPKDGDSGNYRIGLEVSPITDVWVELDDVLIGPGVLTCFCAANAIRPKVLEAEGRNSKVDVYLVGK